MANREPDKECFRCGEPCFGYLCDICRKNKIGTRVTTIRRLHQKREEEILCVVR